jgi:hypothetical protein
MRRIMVVLLGALALAISLVAFSAIAATAATCDGSPGAVQDDYVCDSIHPDDLSHYIDLQEAEIADLEASKQTSAIAIGILGITNLLFFALFIGFAVKSAKNSSTTERGDVVRSEAEQQAQV